MHSCEVEDDDGQYLFCQGYKKNAFKAFIFYFLCLCSGGFLLLVAYWKPNWSLQMRCSICSLQKADYILTKTFYSQWFVEKVITKSVNCTSQGIHSLDPNGVSNGIVEEKHQEIRLFSHRHLTYIWREECGGFQLLRALDEHTRPSTFYRLEKGLEQNEVWERQELFGPNTIDVQVKSYLRLFSEQVADPFYVFQLFSIILWSTDEYYYYASAIFIISVGSILITITQTRNHLITLRSMVDVSESVQVIRSGALESVSSKELVPGDVLVIPPSGMLVPCDGVLISGNCIVNESMLTGESVPVTKTPLPREPSDRPGSFYDPDVHKRHTLYNGTRVIQTRYISDARVLAVVARTGFATTKGSLIRSILCPRPVGFRFLRDAMFFLCFMGVVALAGFTYTVILFHELGWSAGEIALMALDLITIAVPPALPAAMAVGTVYALRRLKQHAIYCIEPSRINICGNLDLICFDKTGTLTEEGLDLLGVVPSENGSFQDLVYDGKCLPFGALLTAMATCHSLTIIDNELSGDPLELKMFQATGWALEEPGGDTEKFGNLAPTIVRSDTSRQTSVELVQTAGMDESPLEVGIVRQFPFSSDVQRMSVITRRLGARTMDAYVKGAPETIVGLCDPNTVPSNFQEVLHQYTTRGYRVLGFAFRPMEPKLSWHNAQRIHREEVEANLNFLGLLVLQNALKTESAPVIRILNGGAIRTVMVTGDNMLTAISVARECEMVQPHEKVVLAAIQGGKFADTTELTWSVVGEVNKAHEVITEFNGNIPGELDGESCRLAVQGDAFALIRDEKPNLLESVLTRGTIFARMSPVQKTHLVEDLQKFGYFVGMCGDGANDCGALKAAHTGISLSEAEASIASPFTSKDHTIECVPKVIREGRAALVTSFGMFKFMALYSAVQFVSVLILYSLLSSLGDLQFLFIDLILIGSLALVMGRTKAYPSLVQQAPTKSLMSPEVFISLVVHIAIQVAFQVTSTYYVRDQSWYIPVNESAVVDDAQIVCHDNVVLFCVTSFQYIMLGLVFSQGPPYRLPAYRNRYLIGVLAVLVVFTVVLTVYPGSDIQEVLELAPMPELSFRLSLVGIAACNFLISFVVEHYVVHSNWLRRLLEATFNQRSPRLYKASPLEEENVGSSSVAIQF